MMPRLSRALGFLRPAPPLALPTFLIGCGRSGTSVLGAVLGRHPQVTFLGEPRQLWRWAYPQTDIWSKDAGERGGKLELTRAEIAPERTRRLEQLLRRELAITGKPHLLEKTPINCFRLDFLLGIFPDAQFIHLIRHGAEVARSIAGRIAVGRWHGQGGYKLRQFTAYAAAHSEFRADDIGGFEPFELGLLEWRLSLEAVLDFAAELTPVQYREVRYEEVLAHPAETVEGLQEFMGLALDAGVGEFAAKELVRQGTVSAESGDAVEKIAGEMMRRAGYG